MYTMIFIGTVITFLSCEASPQHPHLTYPEPIDSSIVIESGEDLKSRFNPPPGFHRQHVDSNTFAFYLRHLPLKAAGTKVKYYNGQIKQKAVYHAVVDMEIGDKNLQQCADAIMRLRGEYFFFRNEFDKISFTLTNGYKVDYAKWTEGYRIVVQQNETHWKKMAAPSNTYHDFKEYMELVFTYAGTLSLHKTLKSKKMRDISIGDVFIVGGSPGHAVIVVDVAENKEGEKVFILAQSYMPAQDTQILMNPRSEDLSPWYSDNFRGKLHTPEWTFKSTDLKTW